MIVAELLPPISKWPHQIVALLLAVLAILILANAPMFQSRSEKDNERN